MINRDTTDLDTLRCFAPCPYRGHLTGAYPLGLRPALREICLRRTLDTPQNVRLKHEQKAYIGDRICMLMINHQETHFSMPRRRIELWVLIISFVP